MNDYIYKRRYTGYDYTPYIPDTICLAWGHAFHEVDGRYVCKHCQMDYELYEALAVDEDPNI